MTIDFLTAQEVGQGGNGLHGIALISDPQATVWVRQGGRWFPVTTADLVWYTDQAPGGPFHPIELFGVCLFREA
ncbi:MAG: hypothetical protein JW785_03095 [Acidimicrobiia bacterium]|nr:hypothetical protein [Acidimicrobiia bacterium]